MTDAAQQRVNMVDSQVRPSDITDRRIIRAMLEIPREQFVPPAAQTIAYFDGDVALGGGRALLAPRTVAKLVQLAELDEGDKVLVAGCATGYAAAVFARMGADVVAVEPDAGLRATAERELQGTGRVQVLAGGIRDGAAAQGPYDVIFLEGGIGSAPSELLDQLKDGGRLVAIAVDKAAGRATVWRRSGRSYGATPGFDAIGPVLPGFQAAPAFSL